MTCKEKLKLDHPDYTDEKVDLVLANECPSDYGILDDPCDPNGNMVCHTLTCVDCWKREVPNRNQYDLINEKIAEITVCHTRINELTNNLEESNKIKEEQLKVINELQAKCNNLEKELNDEKERIEILEYQYTHLVSKYMALDKEREKTADTLCSSGNSCAQSPNDICRAIALSMFNKYHALLDVGFFDDEALKLTVMWKD